VNVRRNRVLQRAVVGLGATLLAGTVVTGGSAAADSGFRYSPGGGCVAKWYSETNEFWLRDVDTNGKRCAVDYYFKGDAGGEVAIRPTDNLEGVFVETHNRNGRKYVVFRVCELKDDDWNCTELREYLT
jgi:hypothetical protein